MKAPIDLLKTMFPHTNLFISLPLKIFKYVAYVHVHSKERPKLDPRALKCLFLGNSPTQKGFKCFHPPIKKK